MPPPQQDPDDANTSERPANSYDEVIFADESPAAVDTPAVPATAPASAPARTWTVTGDDIIGAKAWPTPASSVKGKGAKTAPASSPFLHDIGQAEAEARLLADGGKNVEGRFLVRREDGSATTFVLSVVFKKKPTHHALVRTGDGAKFMLNRRDTG